MFLAYVPNIFKTINLSASVEASGGTFTTVLMAPRTATKRAVEEDAERGPLIARAQGCHENQLEGLPWFFAALLFALHFGVPPLAIDIVALLYPVARVFYIYFYVFGDQPWKAQARSLTFFVCLCSCVYLFIHAAVVAPKPSSSFYQSNGE